MDECGINGIVHKEDTISGSITDNGGMQGKFEKEGGLVGEVGLPKCMCSNDYDDLVNKPSINGVELDGNKTTEDLGIQAGVTSWNGQTGDVVYTPPIAPVQSVNGQTGDVVLDIPTSTSDLINNSGFITNAVNNLVNYYTKSETYTKDEVNAAIGAITTLDIRVVQTLPTEDISTTTIYLVPSSDPQTQNVYDEYIYVSNAWEKIGTTAVDLSNYYTKSEVDALVAKVTDLGDFDIEEYDWDIWTYLEDKTDTGFYIAHETQDGFDYFITIERVGDMVYQEYWYTEESSLVRMCRSGWFNGEEWEWTDATEWVTSENLYANFYQKSQVYNKTEIDNMLGNYYTDAEVDNILENNYYNMDTIDEMFEEFAPNNMIETTWAELVELRDNAELVKGAWYRITDYNFITTKLGLMSGNHPFDIVLLAISESMLSESGYACRHAGDHYFEREITEGGIEWLYTLYVDDYAESYGDEPVDHADDIHSVDVFCDYTYDINPITGDEVPVLFKTDGEEYSIDDPDYDDRFYYEGTYDLDGDEYDMWGKYEFDGDDWVFMQQYALTPIVVEDGELIVSPIPETKIVPVNMNAWELKYCLDNDKELFDWAATGGKGVIYYLKDEFGNEAPYDFKNVLFQRKNITSVSSNILSVFTQGENSRLGLPGNYAVTTGNNNYYYYTFDTPYNAGNDSSLFGDSAYNIIKPYIMDGQRLINNIVLGIANNNTIGNNCFDLTLWGTVRDNIINYNCSNLLMVGVTQCIMTYVRSSTFFSLGATTFGNGCSQNIGSMFTNSEIGDSCNNTNFGTGNMGIKMGVGCANNTFGTYCYNNTFESGVSGCTFGNYCSYNTFEKSVTGITLPNYTRYCKFETGVRSITFTTSGGGNSNYIQYVTVCRGISNLSVAPTRNRAYEQIYYKTGRIETAV